MHFLLDTRTDISIKHKTSEPLMPAVQLPEPPTESQQRIAIGPMLGHHSSVDAIDNNGDSGARSAQLCSCTRKLVSSASSISRVAAKVVPNAIAVFEVAAESALLDRAAKTAGQAPTVAQHQKQMPAGWKTEPHSSLPKI